ncbi:MAG: Y-family DNA polymerase [bacterium]
MFALVDCNNFYASCERVFQPELRDRPVIVLSNNDGCVIAKSGEAEALGFELGDPFFEVEEKVNEHDVAVRSSNYTLYGDMSERVIQTLEQFCPNIEEYSIDEVFLELNTNRNLTDYCRTIAETVEQWTGIPVSIGIGPSKTLTKVAMEVAKEDGRDRVQNTRDWDDLDDTLASIDIEDVWGIGRAYGEECRNNGIETALGLRDCDPRWARDHLTVTGLRRKRELQGYSCIELEEVSDPKKHITCGRMFGEKLTSIRPIREAISTYATRTAERAREEGVCAGYVSVTLRTSRYDPESSFYKRTMQGFNQPTDSSHVITRKAVQCLKSLYESGHRFHKVEVTLGDLIPKEAVQRTMGRPEAEPDDEALMQTIDEINDEFGRDSIQLASAGFDQEWHMNRKHLSRCYTTQWEDLPTVQAS